MAIWDPQNLRQAWDELRNEEWSSSSSDNDYYSSPAYSPSSSSTGYSSEGPDPDIYLESDESEDAGIEANGFPADRFPLNGSFHLNDYFLKVK